MTKITQKQLIESLNQLKEIRPRKEWAVLLKSQILTLSTEALAKVDESRPSSAKASKGQARFAGIMNAISFALSPRKLAYSFAAILFLIVGFFGFFKLLPQEKVPQQTAALTGQTSLKQNLVALNSKINDLATGNANNISSAINEVKTNVLELAKNLKANPTQDPQTIKDIANSLKTLADVSGTDLSSNSDVKNLTQTTVQDLIVYYQGLTLTADQKNVLTQAEDLSSQGKYSDALEEIWTLTNNNNLDNSTTPTNK